MTVLLTLYCNVVWDVRCCLCVLDVEQQFCEVTHVWCGRVMRVEGNGETGTNKESQMMIDWECIVLRTIGRARVGPYSPI